MASTNYISTPSASFNATVSAFFSQLGEIMVLAMESNPRLRRVQALQALSDDELAARGLKRDDIVRHVFRDFL